MSAAERRLRGLKNHKRSIVQSISAITNFTNNYKAERDVVEVPVRLESLNSLWTEFNTVQNELANMDDAEEVFEASLKERVEIERVYYRVKGMLLHYIKPTGSEQQTTGTPQQLPGVKLPNVQIPVFGGDIADWLNFHDLFISLVHSATNLPTIQKFYYLRASLTGDALNLIQTIPITDRQYSVAWQMLVDHYQNPRRLKRTYVQSLFDYPCLKRESSAELHSLLEHFEVNVKILKQQGEQTQHWDTLLVHLLSTRLDPVTRRDWEEHAEANNCEKFLQLTEFLQRRVNVLQTVDGANSVNTQIQHTSKRAGY